ncbi:MAG: nicotinamide-nucleotide amidase [Gammaproteobacteria bacterium]|nr:nicotinamide-nucleotide amidase [Gammaproteobacteria bacterium]
MVNEKSTLIELAENIGKCLQARQLRMACAESCTGGWVAKVVTDIAGSSDWFDRGFVTYSNTAKSEMLGVNQQTLQRFGAVSEQTVIEMAKGAFERSDADIVVAISGIAGPGGGSVERPVGTVWFAWATHASEKPQALVQIFAGDREEVRQQSVEFALHGILKRMSAS